MRPYILHMHERPLTLVKFCNDGDFFVTCAKDGEICLIRTEDCVRIGTYTPPGGSGGAGSLDRRRRADLRGQRRPGERGCRNLRLHDRWLC